MFEDFCQFVRKLYNRPNGIIPLHSPVFLGNEKKYLLDCIDTTLVSSIGDYVDKLEEMTITYTGCKKAIACVNGTNALHIALLLSGVRQNDEVITQPLTFVATVNAIIYTGAVPVFIDVDKNTLGLSPEKLERWLQLNVLIDHNTGTAINKTTKRPITACIPMHTFGHPCLIEELVDLCNKYNINVIEDCAESIGSYFRGKHTGTFGKFGVISYNGNKTITTGGGGMIITNDEGLGNLAKHITTQAKIPHRWEFIHDMVGYNYRMPNLNAALGCAQMEQLDKILELKKELVYRYLDFFSTTSKVDFVLEPNEARSNYWLNTLIFNNDSEKELFLEYTNAGGIMTRPAWKLMSKLQMFQNYQRGDLYNAEFLEGRLVNIPSSINYV